MNSKGVKTMSEDKFTQDNNSDESAVESQKRDFSKELEGNHKETYVSADNKDPADNKDEEYNLADNAEQSDKQSEEATKTMDEAVNPPETTQDAKSKKKSKFNLYDIIRILCLIGFLVFTALFINEVIIQPYRIKKSIDLTRELYNKPTEAPVVTAAPTQPVAEESTVTDVVQATPTPDPNRDEKGRLLQFKDLLAINEDVKGWITIPDTNIDYVVVQSGKKDDPDYYLDKDIKGEYSKAGTLYLDPRSSVEDDTQNLVIHGHNMVSTAEKMFHYLLDYQEVNYYSERPVITFDTIYDTSKWKIFSVFITNGSDDKEPLFDYRVSSFKDSSSFMNFIYQLRIRSLLNIDTVDVNENDQILTLSTCSYELDNYRLVVVARKVREGEDSNVDVASATKNENPLYPKSYYYRYGGEAPDLAATFEEALENDQIKWYIPPL